MIVDRYYQIFVIFIAVLWLREDLIFAIVFGVIPVLFLLMPVVVGLLLWQSAYQNFGPQKMRLMARLRWDLSRSGSMFADNRKSKTSKTILKVYGIDPTIALPEQKEHLRELLENAYAIDRRVPPIFQKSLTATSLGRALTDACDLTGAKRNSFIATLISVEPKHRTVGPILRIKRAFRRIFAPLVGSKVQRRRIEFVYLCHFTDQRIKSDPRLAVLTEAIRRARDTNGLSTFPREPGVFDVIVQLPLGTQRNLVLLSELVFGILNLRRTALTDPGRIKWLRKLKGALDTHSPPDRVLWDTERPARSHPAATPKPKRAATPQPEPTKEELLEELHQEARDAIYLRRAWPIGSDPVGRSWLGGMPCLPKSIPWPRTPQSGTPLHFLAQIDCAELPRVKGGEEMPEDGLLLFFASVKDDMVWEDEGSTRVIFVPASAVPGEPATPPSRLPDIGYVEGSGVSDRSGINSYPCWPISAHPIKTFFWDFAMPMPKLSLAYDLQKGAMQALLPDRVEKSHRPVMANELLYNSEDDPETAPTRRYWVQPELVEAGFPFCGAVMSRFAMELEGNMLASLMENRRLKELWRREGKELSKKAETTMARLTNHLALLAKVSERLDAHADLAVPDPETRQWFTSWLEEMQSKHGFMVQTELRNALLSVVQQAVTDEQMRTLLPSELYEFFDETLCPSATQSEHMMLGHTQFKTNATCGSGIRLLALDSDRGMNFMFCDVGMIEFWILPEDLQRRDFDKAQAYTAGG
ncbi:DUF1963 domain-containing protein [Roseibium sp. RKSG952]|uniref:DUF1963 domain-containing protein n=1 Tax=Roseibium sp. RKSG952 TaxID=2529384 RepID=UPI0012BD2F98|nr:YwqG family protein [Roseibium sp. RKSG952]MTH98986.1 DUF1963 domain-containing protein [Roseibium sp. RKSG952]